MGSDPIFLADAHLGGLGRFLRMLGFDTLHENAYSDAQIRRIAEEEPRIVLTRDRELLKCREIARPFSLCLRCNLPLEPLDKAAAAPRVPEKVLLLQDRFWRCRGCDRVYWPGSHYARMRSVPERAGF